MKSLNEEEKKEIKEEALYRKTIFETIKKAMNEYDPDGSERENLTKNVEEADYSDAQGEKFVDGFIKIANEMSDLILQKLNSVQWKREHMKK